MRTIFMLLIMCFIAIETCAQSKNDSRDLNLDFEQLDGEKPAGWVNYGSGNYLIAVDSAIVQNGKYSVTLEFDGNTPNFKAWALNFPADFEGEKIRLTGYIKTENVSDGYAGLWMRIDPSVAFDNMNDRGVKGTSDWELYEINLNLKPSANNIVVGGMLVGKGKMWLDKLEITIDGRPLDQAQAKEVKKAYKDKEFDAGSGIQTVAMDEKTEDDLYQLGLIWGFLKYYHPKIARGDLNWDYELFRIMPKILSSENSLERDVLFETWIKDLGACEQKKTEGNDVDVKFRPDLDWIRSSGYSAGLVAELEKVKSALRDGDHYCISFVENVGNPNFNEQAYEGMDDPDAGFRLLALYRYWNIIQYYFPYKNLIEEDWKGVLKEFIPKMNAAGKELDYKLTCLELIARVHDTHANVWGNDGALNKYWGVHLAPLKITFIEDQAVVTDFYKEDLGKETDLLVGDVIEIVNDEPVSEIVKKQLKYTPASNYPTQLRDIARKLLRTNDSIIKIEYRRETDLLSMNICAYNPDVLDIYGQGQEKDSCFKLIDEEIAYLHNGTLKRDYIPALWEEIKNTKGLIIDIRNYPSDFPIYTLSAYLMKENKPFVKFTRGSTITPGLFTFGNTLGAGKDNDEYYQGKVVILVNEFSQSSAEFHAMAYRMHPNAMVIGSTTAGADGNMSWFTLPGSVNTGISGIGVYYPDGTETQRVGIVPDLLVTPTIEGVKQNKDVVLEKAIEIIKER
ncbi:MAG: S41 family peptidase [Bacteroidota bacterium]|nr:S41 family peptidase [Bacteroidota bacterium]